MTFEELFGTHLLQTVIKRSHRPFESKTLWRAEGAELGEITISEEEIVTPHGRYRAYSWPSPPFVGKPKPGITTKLWELSDVLELLVAKERRTAEGAKRGAYNKKISDRTTTIFIEACGRNCYRANLELPAAFRPV